MKAEVCVDVGAWDLPMLDLSVECAAHPPSALPGISPPRREIGKTPAPRPNCNVEMAERSPRVDLPTCGGDARQGRGG